MNKPLCLDLVPVITADPDAADKIVQDAIDNIAPISDDQRFDWSASNPHLLVCSQPATAVYSNTFNQVVILQEAHGSCGEEDPFVCISLEYLPALIASLKSFIK